MSSRSLFALFFLVAVLSASSAFSAAVTTFDGGATNGWTASGQQPVSATGGNPGACLPVAINGTFGIDISNNSDPDVIGNYIAKGNQITLSIDIDTDSIIIPPTNTQRSRRLIAELVHYNPPGDFYEYYSAYVDIGQLSAIGIYQTYSVTFDTTGTALPAGWGGYGDEDDDGNFIFPRDKTFADLLSSVDEIRFSTYVPGQVYLPTNFALRSDNITVAAAVPEPASAAMMLLVPAALVATGRRIARFA